MNAQKTGPYQVINGKPVVMHDGAPVPEAGYCDYSTSSPDYDQRIREFAENGVRVFLAGSFPTSSW